MQALRSGRVPLRLEAPVCWCLFVVLGIALAGCARSGPHTQDSWNVGGPPPVVADADRPRVQMEADGLPAQTPPLRREPSEPDDPSEPFSPNYGPRPAPALATKAAVQPLLPDDLPPAFRRQLADALGQ
jgi:hypothetical protein